MKCLILAAGKGSRLRNNGSSKPLIPVLGIPLIERVIRTALEAGVDDFYVVTGYKGERVRAFLDDLSNRLKIRITSIVNKDWEKDNPTKSNRGVKTYDVLKELIALGVTDITIYVTWRISIYNNISFPKGKMSRRDKDLYKKAHDRVYHRCYYTPSGQGKIKDAKMRENKDYKEEVQDNFITNILNKLR